jgi:DNA-binding transcriptional LysR family regulator
MSINQLTLKQLRAFVAVYRMGRLQAAGDALNVTQSAISVLIRQIETALGTRLFDRTMRSLVPTEAAENAIGVAERILRDVDTLDATFQELRDLQRGHVRHRPPAWPCCRRR